MKFKTHNDDESLDVSGTSYKGRIDVDYKTLKKMFGNPKGPSSDGKVDVEWIIKFDNNVVATIYNYKNGPSYLGKNGIPVENIKVWNIGGFNKKVLDQIFLLFIKE